MFAGPATEKFPVVVTSYEIVIADSKLLQRYKWKYVIVDEGHRLKNFNCKLLRELRQIPVDNKLLLTGMTVASAVLLHLNSLVPDYKGQFSDCHRASQTSQYHLNFGWLCPLYSASLSVQPAS